MKLEYTTGCTVSGLDVDEEDFRDLTATKLQELKDSLIDYLEERKLNEDDLEELAIWVTERFGICEHQYYCEQCNDDVYTTTLTI
jgi:hypothetical protein